MTPMLNQLLIKVGITLNYQMFVTDPFLIFLKDVLSLCLKNLQLFAMSSALIMRLKMFLILMLILNKLKLKIDPT